jgi:hypothetical protein
MASQTRTFSTTRHTFSITTRTFTVTPARSKCITLKKAVMMQLTATIKAYTLLFIPTPVPIVQTSSSNLIVAAPTSSSHHTIYPFQFTIMSNDNSDDWVSSSGDSQAPEEAEQWYKTIWLIHAFRKLVDRSHDSKEVNANTAAIASSSGAEAPAEDEKPYPRRSTEEVKQDAYISLFQPAHPSR